jgi:vacuolar protein sorting-associated protein 26
MELEIRRRESTGSGPNTYVETETLAKFELMDGAPVRGTTETPYPSWLFQRHIRLIW